jgi:hypothetical protein
MNEKDFYWLVGILEGEGTFLKGPPSAPNTPRIAVSMTDEDVIQKVASLFGVKYVQIVRDPRNNNWKTAYSVKLAGKSAMTLMRQLQPHMSKRRQEQIQRALDSYNPLYKRDRRNASKLTAAQVIELRSALAQYEGRSLPRGRLTALAAQYGITRRTVHRIRVGAIWKEVA